MRLGGEKPVASGPIFYQTPKAIIWELKDVGSHQFTGDMSESQVGETACRYCGTIRALAAQAIQKEVLGDLAWVCPVVAPTVDNGASVTGYLGDHYTLAVGACLRRGLVR